MGRLSQARKKAQAKQAEGVAVPQDDTSATPSLGDAAHADAVNPPSSAQMISQPGEANTGQANGGKSARAKAQKAKDKASAAPVPSAKNAQEGGAPGAEIPSPDAQPAAVLNEAAPATAEDAEEIAWVAATLAEIEETAASDSPKKIAPGKLPTSGLAEDILRDHPGPEPQKAPVSASRPSLPSSGLAEDILRAAEDASVPLAADMLHTLAQDASISATVAKANPDEPLEWGILEALSREEKANKAAGSRNLPSSGLADEILGMDAAAPVKRSLSLDEIHEFENFFDEEAVEESTQYVLFSIAREVFGVEIEKIREVLRVPVLTRVPNCGPDILGVFNLRGRIVPLFDLRNLLNLPRRKVDKDSRILILEAGSRLVSVLIDRVREVSRIDMRDIEPTPEEIALVDRNMVSAVARNQDQMIFLLDLRTVLGQRSLAN
jgi:purine-binding chemotaxis protein CheW